MKNQEIFENIKKSFCNLWKSRYRGTTLEIITPYATSNNRFVSVFLSTRGNDFIISDGGWIGSNGYDTEFNDDESFIRSLSHFKESFDIKEVESPDGVPYFYVKTDNPIELPSKILDISMFIQNVISLSEISFEDKEEKIAKQRFLKEANDFLKNILENEKLKINGNLDKNIKVRFNAIYTIKPNEIALINYVTGSNPYHFTNSIAKTSTYFQMADDSKYKQFISSKISLIDDTANGFLPQKIDSLLSHLKNHTGSTLVNWSEKDRIASLLN